MTLKWDGRLDPEPEQERKRKQEREVVCAHCGDVLREEEAVCVQMWPGPAHVCPGCFLAEREV